MCKCLWYAVLSILLISLIPLSAAGCINVNMPGPSTDKPPKVDETTPPVAAVLPTIESFSANPATIISGKSSTLSWSVKNATSVMIAPDIGTVPATGSKEVKPSALVTYVLTASNADGTSYGQVTINVPPSRMIAVKPQLVTSLPIIASFSASPGTITTGGSSTLNWNVTNATSVMIVPEIGSVSATGSKAVKPPTATMYTLVASNASGMVSKPVTVNVLSVKIIKPEFQPVVNKPDLIATTGLELSGNRVIYHMQNSGEADAVPFVNGLYVDGKKIHIGSFTHVLPSGGLATEEIRWPPGFVETTEPHAFEVRLDDFNDNNESNENNNSISASFNYRPLNVAEFEQKEPSPPTDSPFSPNTWKKWLGL